MINEPKVTSYLDDDERALIEALDADDAPTESVMTPDIVHDLQQAARNTLNEASEKISLRLLRTDLARIKARALREGVPYQTLIKSILHQSVR